MNSKLLFHLWKSDDVRKAMISEIARLCLIMSVYIASLVVYRYYTERPILDDIGNIIVICVGIFLAWGFSIVRTLNIALKDNEKHISGQRR